MVLEKRQNNDLAGFACFEEVHEITGLSWQNIYDNKYLGVGMFVTKKVGDLQI